MNRRSFLKTMAAVVGAVALPSGAVIKVAGGVTTTHLQPPIESPVPSVGVRMTEHGWRVYPSLPIRAKGKATILGVGRADEWEPGKWSITNWHMKGPYDGPTIGIGKSFCGWTFQELAAVSREYA